MGLPQMQSGHPLPPKPPTSMLPVESCNHGRHRHRLHELDCAPSSLAARVPLALKRAARVAVVGGGALGTSIVGHNHGSFTGFLFVARTLTAEATGLHVTVHGVYWPIRGSGHGLLLVGASASPLRMPMVGARSYHMGHPAAVVGCGLHGH
jgi:hypothetical protein